MKRRSLRAFVALLALTILALLANLCLGASGLGPIEMLRAALGPGR